MRSRPEIVKSMLKYVTVNYACIEILSNRAVTPQIIDAPNGLETPYGPNTKLYLHPCFTPLTFQHLFLALAFLYQKIASTIQVLCLVNCFVESKSCSVCLTYFRMESPCTCLLKQLVKHGQFQVDAYRQPTLRVLVCDSW